MSISLINLEGQTDGRADGGIDEQTDGAGQDNANQSEWAEDN